MNTQNDKVRILEIKADWLPMRGIARDLNEVHNILSVIYGEFDLDESTFVDDSITLTLREVQKKDLPSDDELFEL